MVLKRDHIALLKLIYIQGFHQRKIPNQDKEDESDDLLSDSELGIHKFQLRNKNGKEYIVPPRHVVTELLANTANYLDRIYTQTIRNYNKHEWIDDYGQEENEESDEDNECDDFNEYIDDYEDFDNGDIE